MGRSHPLSSDKDWTFHQHGILVRAPVLITPNGSKTGRKKVISASSTCREGVVSGIRNQLRSSAGRVKQNPNSWNSKYTLNNKVELDHEPLKQPKQSYITVNRYHVVGNIRKANPKAGKRIRYRTYYWNGPRYAYRKEPAFIYCNGRMTKTKAQQFIYICDAVIGPLTVLLNPDRYAGNWWHTSVEECMSHNGTLTWYGVDNTVLQHPAFVSLYTGLVRQCALLARTDKVEQLLATVSRTDVRNCLNNSDPEQAWVLAKKMRPWIEVPTPKSGGQSNIPIPKGSFFKIPMLHKAIYANGFRKTFGKSFADNWSLAGDPYGYARGVGANWRGIHNYLGVKGDSANAVRIKNMSKEVSEE